MSKKEIWFRPIIIIHGFICFLVKQITDERARTRPVYIKFDSFVPSEDTVALVLASFCGSGQYHSIYMDLSICRDTFEKLNNWLEADLSVHAILDKDYFPSTSLTTDLQQIRMDGTHAILNYSGGMDSLAFLCCLPPKTKLVSVYFTGYEREFKFFRKYNTHIVKTNVRRFIPIDENSWEFMGFASILYKDYYPDTNCLLFGSIAESARWGLEHHFTRITGQDVPLYHAAGMILPHCTHALTELGTALIVAYYKYEEMFGSLCSIEDIGSEKLYRKECLSNIACEMLGLDPIVNEYHFPENKLTFGNYITTDFLSLCIAKYLGVDFAAAIYEELPQGFEEFVQTHTLSFYKKIKQDNLSIEPKDLIQFFCSKCQGAGLEYYQEDDYREIREVLAFLDLAKDT
ncbi:MAG: hypothetical protein IJH53_09410 [Oscillospiraceae bacterium]|nr:hypothetical protein [Oscillospiraceae bacterium]